MARRAVFVTSQPKTVSYRAGCWRSATEAVAKDAALGWGDLSAMLPPRLIFADLRVKTADHLISRVRS